MVPESSREELEEKRRPKRSAFSLGELATEPSGRIRGGKEDLQKLLEIFWARGQKLFPEGEKSRPAHLFLINYA